MTRYVFPALLLAFLASRCIGQSRFPQMWTKQPEIRIARFHALWVFAGFEQQACLANEQLLESTFERFNGDFLSFGKTQGVNMPANLKISGSPRILSGKHITWKDVILALDQLEISLDSDSQENDVVFVYVLTHGKVSDELPESSGLGNPSGSQSTISLFFNNVSEPRKSLADRVDRIPARLKVLITDNCSFDSRVAKTAASTELLTGIWRALYFGHTGMVDVSSSSVGEAANLVNGKSLFNETFNEAFNIYALERDAPGAEKVREKVNDTLMNLRTGNTRGAITSADQARDEFQTLLESGIRGQVKGVVEWETEFVPYLQQKLDAKRKRYGITSAQTIKVWPNRKFRVNGPSS